MQKLILLFAFTALLQVYGTSQAVFELDPQQSMLITGKGPGQDGAINPYSGEKSISIVKNLGEMPFSVRIQEKGNIIETREVTPKESESFVLEKSYELYLDCDDKAKAKVNFKRFKEK